MPYKILSALLLVLATVSCGQGKYRIDGRYTAPDGTPVWLIDRNSNDTLAGTSVLEGRFSFEGTVREPTYMYVGNGKERVHLILESGVAKVDIGARTASGMPMEDLYMAFHRRFYGFSRNQKEQKAALADSMVRANPDNLAGALALEDLAYVDTTLFLSLRTLLSKRMQEFYLVQSAYDAIQLENRTAPGRHFTDYLIPGGNPDGTDVSLSTYVGQGKFILLDHWASWCGPCKKEMPHIRKTWEDFHGERFEVVSIAVNDKREDTLEALQELDLPWPQILDAQRLPVDIYGVKAIPHLILFGPDGTILRRGIRGEEIYSAVADALGGK